MMELHAPRFTSPRQHVVRRRYAGKLAALLAICVLAVAPAPVRAGLIINEVLANEPGSATSAEWFELLNWPDTGSAKVSLAGYRFIDGGDTTLFDTALEIPAGGFLIMARKATGASSFESIWGDNSGIWGDAPGESYPLVGASKMSLRNSGDTATLLSPEGIVSRLIWHSDAGDGVSIERRRPGKGDNPGNFAACIDPSGSTPGRANSLLPVQGDLALDSLWITILAPAWGESLGLVVSLTNIGLGEVTAAIVDLYQDVNPRSDGSELSLVYSWTVPAIGEEETQLLSFDWTQAPPGRVTLVAKIRSDAVAANDSSAVSVTVRYTEPLIVISEYLAAPDASGPDEWVEIVNLAGVAIDMSGVRIGDSLNAEVLPSPTGLMPPGAFWVLAESAANFRVFYPDFAGTLLEIPGWRALNNTGDRVRLVGAAGEIIDSLSFRTTHDHNLSTERVELLPRFASEDDWTFCRDPSGSTPGRVNSVVRGQPGWLALDSLAILPVQPAWSETLDVTVNVANIGFGPVRGASVRLLQDLHWQMPGTELAEIHRWQIDSIGEGERRHLEFSWPDASPGAMRLLARAMDEHDSIFDEEVLVTTIRHTQPLIVISEYLAESGPGGPGEWIEIANVSDLAISMFAVRIGDSDGVSVLPPDMGRMPPGAVWILAENTELFDAYYHGFDGMVWQVPGWRELGDHGDRVRLLGAAVEVIDSVCYVSTYGANRSTERRELTAAFADPRDWGGSVDPSGATPGRPNSIRRLTNDLAIDSLMIVTSDPTWGTEVAVRGIVTNVGFDRVSQGGARVFYTCDTTSSFQRVRQLCDFGFEPLEPGSSLSLTCTWFADRSGIGRVFAVLHNDEDLSNNNAGCAVVVRHTQPAIIVSEYLADPQPGGPGEWIEICNMSGFAINLTGVQIGDSSGTASLPVAPDCMPSEALWVLAENAASFRSFYVGFTGVLLEVDGWRELNNGGDRIRLIGAAGEIIDSLSYRETQGDNRSLERVALSVAFATDADWAASVDPTGATPGQANSVDRQKAGAFHVDVSPNPFYRSRGEAAQIAYRMEIGEQLTLQVYDRAGHRVRTIVEDQPAATGSIAWDARDDDGRELPPGPYILLARSDPSGAIRKIVVVIGP